MDFVQRTLDLPLALSNLSIIQCLTNVRSLALSALTALAHTSPHGPPKQIQPSYHDNAGVLAHVNPLIGTSGDTPNGNGGMIPSVSPPFGMTRWTPQTRENFISQCPYGYWDAHIHGFQATHQPAIWMGDSGFVVLQPGMGGVRAEFEERGRRFEKVGERSEVYVYEVIMEARASRVGMNSTESVFSPVPGGGQDVPEEVREGANGRVRRDAATLFSEELVDLPAQMQEDCEDDGTHVDRDEKIEVAMTASAHVGHLRVDFPAVDSKHGGQNDLGNPHIFIQATRQNWTGHITIHPVGQEVSGSNPQRQDYALGPDRAIGFSGYFVSRFSKSFSSYGITKGGSLAPNVRYGHGEHIGAWVGFDDGTERVEVRTGVSFVSVDQARRNLDIEAPDNVSFDDAVETLKRAWLEKLGRVTIDVVDVTAPEHDQRTIWYTGLFHALQYPSDFSEPLEQIEGGRRTWYEGYTDSVHEAEDSYYQSWSIWDTFRAEHSLLTIFAPERVNSMMRSLLRIYDYSGRLPMWANVVETNIMIGTHVDAVLSNALSRGFSDFNITKAWDAVRKNAFVPPENDTQLLYYDREPYTPLEVRAGLTSYMSEGYVANDQWAEAGSRTLDYAFDDHAAAHVARHAGHKPAAAFLQHRSKSYQHLFNPTTGFMNSRNANGSFAAPEHGWTEGDAWIYTFAVPHDPLGLAALFTNHTDTTLKEKLDEYFAGGHNDHTNEPSHHAPYLYAAIGYPAATQELVRKIAGEEYNATAAGLSGNEDLGQMSAWYVFAALGFYPLDPAGDEYVVGRPFFETVRLKLPALGGVAGREVVISAPGASTGKGFVTRLRVDGVEIERPVLRHGQILRAARIEFVMSEEATSWGEGP